MYEMKQLAARILALQGECPDDGNFTPDQQSEAYHAGIRLAELVEALDERQVEQT